MTSVLLCPAKGAATAPRATLKILQYVLRDVVRARWLLAHASFFLLVTEALLRFGGGGTRALISLTNVTLLVAPLVGIVFGTMYVHDARAFNELLLAQPVRRRQLFAGLYLGVTLPLVVAFVVGVGTPFVLHGLTGSRDLSALGTLLVVGAALTFVFAALAFLIAVRTGDRARGLGLAIAVWLAASVLYDGAVLLVATMFADYPLERPMLALMLLNPVDLARVLLLLQLDVSALMGYTGAVFQRFFGGATGIGIAAAALALWIVVPVTLALRRFRGKDF
ncbi:MAG TPA: ABC transporter permease subunit [Gemmatimonadaceae bacterium]|nr:ABC transporter permease subunit [Gemmatimonadaceae bacterium]